ncbi:hypothetical protein ABPG75_011939 [Micractinium tetrahymenae]
MKLAGPGLLAALLLRIAARGVAADSGDSKPYDLLVLQLEWAPNDGALSVNQVVPTNAEEDNPSQKGGCPSTPFDASQIPPDVQAELQCIFYNPSDGCGSGGGSLTACLMLAGSHVLVTDQRGE